MIDAVSRAMSEPQPTAVGPAPQLAAAASGFASNLPTFEAAVRQLLHLGEVLDDGLRETPTRSTEEIRSLHRAIAWAIVAVGARWLILAQSLARFDGPTGLLNKTAYQTDVEAELGSMLLGDLLTFVLADLDGLKAINDREGHRAGDEAIRNFTSALNESRGAHDSAYRVGGDEFAVLMRGSDRVAAEELIVRVSAMGPHAFSWGAETYVAHVEEWRSVEKRADDALYAMKTEHHASEEVTTVSTPPWPSEGRPSDGRERQ